MTTLARIFFSTLVAMTLLAPFAQAQTKVQEILTDFDAATAQSQAEAKPLMVVFSGSDWCKPCILFKQQVLETASFKEYSRDRMVVCNLDFPIRKQNQLPAEQRKKNDAVAAQYNPEGAFPLVLILDDAGTVHERINYKTHSGADVFIADVSKSLGE